MEENPLIQRLDFIALIFANLLLFVGMLVWGWSALDVLLVYWAESAIIGFFTVARIFLSKEKLPLKVFLSGFFCFHFGIFMFVHLMFIIAFTSIISTVAFDRFSSMTWFAQVFIILIGLFLAQLLAFLKDFSIIEKASIANQMFKPYPRIFVMQITIIFGFMLALFFPPLIVIIKLLAELAFEKVPFLKSWK